MTRRDSDCELIAELIVALKSAVCQCSKWSNGGGPEVCRWCDNRDGLIAKAERKWIGK